MSYAWWGSQQLTNSGRSYAVSLLMCRDVNQSAGYGGFADPRYHSLDCSAPAFRHLRRSRNDQLRNSYPERLGAEVRKILKNFLLKPYIVKAIYSGCHPWCTAWHNPTMCEILNDPTRRLAVAPFHLYRGKRHGGQDGHFRIVASRITG